jgi:hypothetical protein
VRGRADTEQAFMDHMLDETAAQPTVTRRGSTRTPRFPARTPTRFEPRRCILPHRPIDAAGVATGYDRLVQVETLEQIAARLGWSPQRIVEAHARAHEPRPSNINDRDQARAEALSQSVTRTRRALDEAS